MGILGTKTYSILWLSLLKYLHIIFAKYFFGGSLKTMYYMKMITYRHARENGEHVRKVRQSMSTIAKGSAEAL